MGKEEPPKQPERSEAQRSQSVCILMDCFTSFAMTASVIGLFVQPHYLIQRSFFNNR